MLIDINDINYVKSIPNPESKQSRLYVQEMMMYERIVPVRVATL